MSAPETRLFHPSHTAWFSCEADVLERLRERNMSFASRHVPKLSPCSFTPSAVPEVTSMSSSNVATGRKLLA